jgi:hypothetical protein
MALALSLSPSAAFAEHHEGGENPCAAKADNPCNPCGAKAANPCNPCGTKVDNPCNPCAAKDKPEESR